MATHRLTSTPETVRWGIFDAAIPPVLTDRAGRDGGDRMRLRRAGDDAATRQRLRDPAGAACDPRRGPAPGRPLITGPVAIAGAEPGDALEVRIEAIEFGADWGYCGFRPLLGTLPEDFPERYLSHIPIDRAARTCRLPWGTELPLAPFFGVTGVAPPPEWGPINTKEPRAHGGNLDNKELVAGSTLFLPVFVPGANFSAGDGHGVQGDGEVCINALETCLTGTFTFALHKRAGLRYPRAETPTHFISMGMHEDLDVAMKTALREMIAFIAARSNLSREQAYQFCSLAVDFHVTQTVNGEKGIHGMLRKGLLF